MRRGRRASLRRVGSPPSTHTVCLVSPQAPVTQPLGTRPRAAPHAGLLACCLNWSLSNPSGRHARLKSITARRRRQVATAAQGGFAAPCGLQRPQGRGDGGSAPPRSRLRHTRQNDRTPVARSDSEALAAPKDQPSGETTSRARQSQDLPQPRHGRTHHQSTRQNEEAPPSSGHVGEGGRVPAHEQRARGRPPALPGAGLGGLATRRPAVHCAQKTRPPPSPAPAS